MIASAENTTTMVRYRIMSWLGLTEPLVRLQRRIDASNRRALQKAAAARAFERAA